MWYVGATTGAISKGQRQARGGENIRRIRRSRYFTVLYFMLRETWDTEDSAGKSSSISCISYRLDRTL